MLLRDYQTEDWATICDIFRWISSTITYDIGYDGDREINVDSHQVERELEDLAKDLIDEFHSDLVDNLAPEINEIVSKIDIDQMVEAYLSKLQPDEEEFCGSSSSAGNDIEDLFERT